ncbi:MAG: ankyrin repeat domain-containing protein [Candidatus Algichlamydia australiensis]|nr:ankyrin repeat domain-containing protein [Chlamydiales bacterium]
MTAKLEKESGLLGAILEGNFSETQGLLNGFDFNAILENGKTALSNAVSIGNREIVKLLLENRADPNVVKVCEEEEVGAVFLDEEGDSGYETVLCKAVRKGQKEIAKMLLEHNADPNNWANFGLDSVSISLEVGNFELTELLLENGGLKGLDETRTRNAIIRFIDNSKIDLFLKYAQEIQISIHPICYAINEGKFEVGKQLLALKKGSFEFVKTPFLCGNDFEELVVAVFNEEVERVKKILLKEQRLFKEKIRGCSIFELLDFIENEEIKKHLASHTKRFIDVRDYEGKTQLIVAISSHKRVVFCFENTQKVLDNLPEIKRLLKYGADPNLFDDNFMTPLRYAAQKKDEELAYLLIEHQANIQDSIDKAKEREAPLEEINFLESFVGRRTKGPLS